MGGKPRKDLARAKRHLIAAKTTLREAAKRGDENQLHFAAVVFTGAVFHLAAERSGSAVQQITFDTIVDFLRYWTEEKDGR